MKPRKPNRGGGQPPPDTVAPNDDLSIEIESAAAPPEPANKTKPKVKPKRSAKAQLLGSSALSSPPNKPAKANSKPTKAAAGAAAKAKEFADFHNSARNDSEPKRKPNGKAPPREKNASPPTDYYDDPFYLERIAKAKVIGTAMERSWWEICKLLDEIIVQYCGYWKQPKVVKERKEKIQRFAADINVGAIVYCTLERRLRVFRKWEPKFRQWAEEEGNSAPGPESFHLAVLRALAGLDDRLELLRANPTMTKAAAEELRRDRKDDDEDEEDTDDEEDDESDPDDWRQKEDKKYFKDLLIAASKAEDIWASYPEDPSVARKHATAKSLPLVKACAEAWNELYERMKSDLCGEEAAGEGDERLSSTVARAQESNGNDEDLAQSAEDRKALYSDEGVLSDATEAVA
jgi:hypothetical protein